MTPRSEIPSNLTVPQRAGGRVCALETSVNDDALQRGGEKALVHCRGRNSRLCRDAPVLQGLSRGGTVPELSGVF
jgi:hypothetical protein